MKMSLQRAILLDNLGRAYVDAGESEKGLTTFNEASELFPAEAVYDRYLNGIRPQVHDPAGQRGSS